MAELIRGGASVWAVDGNGQSALHSAAFKSRVSKVLLTDESCNTPCGFALELPLSFSSRY